MDESGSQFSFFTLGLILLVASLVAIASRRLRLPYSAGLVVGGIALGLLPVAMDVTLSRDLIFNVFLPPLVFEAALQLEWKSFRRELPLTATLAFAGVALAACVVAVGMRFAAGWSWIGSALFGALIAATDPVSVIAAFREMSVARRLAVIVESESLLNDGAAAVAFSLLAGAAAGQSMSAGSIAVSFLWTAAGGVTIGVAVAGGLLLIAGRTTDHLVEITLTTLAAYGSFLLAERVHASGVLATLSAGLLVGNFGMMRSIAESSRGHVTAFWEYAAFLANSVVFVLIGDQEVDQHFKAVATAAGLAIGLVLLARASSVYLLSAALRLVRRGLETRYQHVLVWGGLRGALALALALALPAGVPERSTIVAVAFAVVAFSIFVQGLTMPLLIRRLGLAAPGDGRES